MPNEVIDLTAPAADDAGTTTPDDDTSAAADTAAPAEDPTAKLIEDMRKRQGGAEKARQEAERLLKQTQDELAALKAGKAPAKPDSGESDFETRLKELEAKYEQKANEAIAKVQGEALSARFPAARAKFPEITDPVKLAELEVLFGESSAPPAPIGNNPPRQAAPATKTIEDMTLAELEASLRSMDKSVIGL